MAHRRSRQAIWSRCVYGRKTQAESSSLELTVAKEKKVGALRKKLAGLDKQVSNISVIDPTEYKLKMCVHCGFLQVSCFKCYIKTVCLIAYTF